MDIRETMEVPELSRFAGIIIKMLLMIQCSIINRMYMCIMENIRHQSVLTENCLPGLCL